MDRILKSLGSAVRWRFLIAGASLLALSTVKLQAALLAYEPFTNSAGSAVIGSTGGFGFTGAWQANSSAGVATNISSGLAYVDANSNALVTAVGGAFFQGSTSASSAMQPIRPFVFARGTNGVDGVTTWISFLIARQGPTGTLAGNPFGRGANVPHDFGTLQKLSIGNSSGAGSNTVGLIPTGAAANLKGATNLFGGVTNFVVVRIDHLAGAANDNAYLFVNPLLNVEPGTNAAGAVSLGGFDFSLNQLRLFAGGNSSAAQPYAELLVDEYRLGETYADVTPFNPGSLVVTPTFQITNAWWADPGIALAGLGGGNGATFQVLTATDPNLPILSWTPIATNSCDAAGRFQFTNAIAVGPQQFFRLRLGNFATNPVIAPTLSINPSNQSVAVGGTASFFVTASGTTPLKYQWFFNSTTMLGGATNASLSLLNVQSNQSGAYHVVVSNSAGTATSAVAMLIVVAPPALLPGAFFVSPSGNDANAGTEASPFLTITKGLNTITTSGTVYLRGGVHAQPSKLSLTRTGITNGAIRLWAYPGEQPVINSSGNTSDGVSISGKWYHLKGLTVVNAGHNGINLSGHSNIVEFCTVRSNGNTGLHITGGSSGTTFPSYNLILNCDAYLNYDPPIGGNADGFSAKWNLGPGNVFRGCRAWWNSDDGWDLWMGTDTITIDQCWAFYNGTNYWNDPQFNGNGQGFKLGGNYIGAPHRLLRSVAFRNESNGVDQNNNIAGQTVDNTTGWANRARNFNLNHGTNTTPHVVRNNLSFAAVSGDSFRSGTLLTNNSWQVITAPSVGTSDVLSVDESVATAPRNPDGSLPSWPFLRPVSGGRLINKGTILTEPYTGVAPDLGAFEDGL